MTQSTIYQSLDAIGLRTGTDKASVHHGFLDLYERFFAPLRGAADVRVLEIGVAFGSSLRMWREWLPAAKIIGIDIEPKALDYASDDITIELVDQSDVAQLTALAQRHGPFDLVLDDGSHIWDHQITTLRTLLPQVRPGGFFVMEDLDTSYGTFVPDYAGISPTSCAAYLQRLSDYVVADSALDRQAETDAFIRSYAPRIEFIVFAKRTCVIKLRER